MTRKKRRHDNEPSASSGPTSRQRAEMVIRENAAQSSEPLEDLSPEALRQMLHELRLKQIELELKNEELHQTQLELDASLVRYFDLDDTAPIGNSEDERGVLELLASGRTLPDVLTHLVLSYEMRFPGLRGSVLLLDPDGRHLRHGAAPNMPPAYCRAIDGVEIGPGVGSCGTAAYTGKTTMVADISHDPLWENFKDLALAHELRACWSVPILGAAGRVLGTFAFYFNTPRVATSSELATIERGTHLASLAIVRERTEAALATTTELLERIGEMSKVGGWELDLRTMSLFWSLQTYRIHEVDPLVTPSLERAIGFYTPEVQPVIRDAVQAGIDRGTPWDLELSMITTNGHGIWVRAQGSAVMEDGKAIKLIGAFQDITKRKQAETNLRQSEILLRESQVVAGLGSYVLNIATGLWSSSEMMDKVFGIDEAYERSVEGWLALIHPDDRAMMDDYFRRVVLGQRRDFDKEYRIIRRNDQTERWVCGMGKLEFDARGCPKRMLGTITDITERKHAEELLRVSDVALKAVSQGVLITGADRRILSANAAFTAISGYSEAEILGQNWKFLRGPLTDPDTVEAIRLALENASEFSGEILNYRKDGTSFWNELTLSPVRDEQGQLTHFISVTRDISVRKQIDYEFRESRQRLEVLSRQLITTREVELRHLARELHDEIGQVLTAMKMNVRAIQRSADPILCERLEENVSMIDRAVEQVRNLALDMRPPHLDDLGLVATLHWYLKHQAKIAGFQEHLSVDPAEIRIPPDLATVCFRITQEAVTNAVRHATPHQIAIELRQIDEELHLAIRDDGIGFDVGNARARASGGASLGLISMQERASLAGGRIEFESIPGMGTTIHAWFPLSQL